MILKSTGVQLPAQMVITPIIFAGFSHYVESEAKLNMGQFSPPLCEGSWGNVFLQTHLLLVFLSTAGIILAIKLSLLMRVIIFNPACNGAWAVSLIPFWHACSSQHSPGSPWQRLPDGSGADTPLEGGSQIHNQLRVKRDQGEMSGLTKSIVEINSWQKTSLHFHTPVGLEIAREWVGSTLLPISKLPELLHALWGESVWGGNGKPLKLSIPSASLPRHGQTHGLVLG